MVRIIRDVGPYYPLYVGGNKSMALDGLCGVGRRDDLRSDKGGEIVADKVSDPAFRVMCEMWGVDAAVKTLKHMGMTATAEQITAARDKEAAAQEQWNTIFKQEPKGE